MPTSNLVTPQTTLSVDIDAITQYVPLTSVADAFAPGPQEFRQCVVYMDREAMLVRGIAGNQVIVSRGFLGTPATAHTAGVTAWVAPIQAYGQKDPSGSFYTPQGQYLPLVVIPTGNVWNDASGQWAVTSGPGAIPAGSDTEIQYNDHGAFGADSSFTFNGTTLEAPGLSSTGDLSVTGNGTVGGTLAVTGTLTGGSVLTPAVTVATLPGTPVAGQRSFVTDANAVSFTAGIGAVVAAGGSTEVPVVYDGTNWRIG